MTTLKANSDSPAIRAGLSGDYPMSDFRMRPLGQIMEPEPGNPQEVEGNVVFPTGIDQRNDLGTPDRFDIYYGMADERIGVARLDLPEVLPAEKVADAPGGWRERITDETP